MNKEKFITSTNIEYSSFIEGAIGLLHTYEQMIETPEVVKVGQTTNLEPIYIGESPPMALREYQVYYPDSLIKAYQMACDIYDDHFMKPVEMNKTNLTDYQFAPNTLAFQVDGPAYPKEFLDLVSNIDPQILAQFIMLRVFEFETNIAAYNLNNRLWPNGTTNQTWHEALDVVREKTGKQVAVLAGDDLKLEEMVWYEMGVSMSNLPRSEAIRELTGFDAFLGPKDVLKIYEQYQGNDCPYVFFGRTSKPKSWLKKPYRKFGLEFLSDLEILKYVRAYALTHNFDDPNLPLNDPEIMMDSKNALLKTSSAYLVTEIKDIFSVEFLHSLVQIGIIDESWNRGILTPKQSNKLGMKIQQFPSSRLLSSAFEKHLQERGVDPLLIASGEQPIRAKPLKQHYGIYGHITGPVNKYKVIKEIISQMKTRGYYILQPEFKNLTIIDRDKPNQAYLAIDRVFMVRDVDRKFQPMESCRSLMPLDTLEGRKNNVHEGPNTKCAAIVI